VDILVTCVSLIGILVLLAITVNLLTKE